MATAVDPADIFAERIREFPNIRFWEEDGETNAILAGTGLKIWEIAMIYRNVGFNFGDLCQAMDWLTGRQLMDALAYAEQYPDEIQSRIADNDAAEEALVRSLS